MGVSFIGTPFLLPMYPFCEISYIYVLSDPTSNLVRYVGQSVNPKRRFVQHIKDQSTSYKVNWINKLKSVGELPTQKVIASYPLEDISEKENYWIGYYEDKDSALTNSLLHNDTRSSFEIRRSLRRLRGSIGVHFNSFLNKWLCRYHQNSRILSIGSFKSKVVAQKHYDNVARYYEKYPVTNFEGVNSYSIETARKISLKIDRAVRFGHEYFGINYYKKHGVYKVRLKLTLEGKYKYLASFRDLERALEIRDAVANYYNLPTYKYHKASPIGFKEAKSLAVKELRESFRTRSESGYRGVFKNNSRDNYLSIYFKPNSKEITIASFIDKEEARLWHDRVAAYYNQPVNREPDFKCSLEEARSLLRKKKNQSGLLGVYPSESSYVVKLLHNYVNYNIGSFSTVEEATYYADAVRNYFGMETNGTTRDALSPEEALQKIGSTKPPKGIRKKGKNYTVRISFNKKEHTVSGIENLNLAIYLSDALRNYYGLPNNHSTETKLSLEEAKQLVKSHKLK